MIRVIFGEIMSIHDGLVDFATKFSIAAGENPEDSDYYAYEPELWAEVKQNVDFLIEMIEDIKKGDDYINFEGGGGMLKDEAIEETIGNIKKLIASYNPKPEQQSTNPIRSVQDDPNFFNRFVE